MDAVSGTDEFCVDVAKRIGLNTEGLMGFNIDFRPNNIVTVEAEYVIEREALNDVITKVEKLRGEDHGPQEL